MLFHLNSGKTLDLTPDEYAEIKKKIRCFDIIEACRAVIHSGTFTEEGGKYGDIQILLGDKELEEIADKALDTIKDNFLSDTMPFVREAMDKWYRKNERRCKPYVIAVTGTVRVNCPECMPVEKANQKLFEVVSKNTFEPLVCIKMMELPPVDKKDGTIDYGAMVSVADRYPAGRCFHRSAAMAGHCPQPAQFRSQESPVHGKTHSSETDRARGPLDLRKGDG